jgi:hypothetical protein
MSGLRIAGDDGEIAESVRANYAALDSGLAAALEPGYFRAGRIFGRALVWLAGALLAVVLVSGVVLDARLLWSLL